MIKISLVCCLLLFYIAAYRGYRQLTWAAYVGMVLSTFLLLPLARWGEQPTLPPSQIIYRFDENRYLQLTGYGCEGALHFVDEKEQVYTELAIHSATVALFPFYHPAKNYIAIPYSDLSGVRVSADGGRTFHQGSIIRRPPEKEVHSFTVVNDQGFLLTNSGEIFYSGKPFGGLGGIYVSQKEIDKTVFDYSPGFQNLPKTVPPVPADYQGWDHMRCQYDMEGTALPNPLQPLITLQQTLQQLFGLGAQQDEL